MKKESIPSQNKITCEPFPASRKIYVKGQLHDIAVAMREISLNETTLHGKEGATETPATKVELSEDQKTVRLIIPTLKTGFVTSFQLAINSTDDEDPRHDQFYYTLNNLPD